jgi:hypothetical protein
VWQRKRDMVDDVIAMHLDHYTLRQPRDHHRARGAAPGPRGPGRCGRGPSVRPAAS